MAEAVSSSHKEKNLLVANQLCVATQNFDGQEVTDLPFKLGDRLTIIGPCELMYWYKARDEYGREGTVPENFLRPLDVAVQQPKTKAMATSNAPTSPPTYGNLGNTAAGPLVDEGYLKMNPATLHTPPPTVNMDREVLHAHEKEKQRRLQPGTLVMGTCPFEPQQPGDLPFNMFDEMMIIKPLPDLCWYMARRTDRPDLKGTIPVTHIRLVYMSDDEEDTPTRTVNKERSSSPLHESLYDDVQDFMGTSGWFSHSGVRPNKDALKHVLAKKCKLSYEKFMSIKKAVYKFDYRNGEKTFIGKAYILNEVMSKHFEHFGKKRTEIREIDDELCHHTDVAGWEVIVWPLEPGEDLEVEAAKKMIELDALVSEDGTGITEEMTFTSVTSFDKFWGWLFPNK